MTPCTSRLCDSGADSLASIGGHPPAPYCLDCIATARRRIASVIVTDLPPETPEMSPTFLPLILRPDADAHPELCRIDGCTKPIQARGLCMSDYSRVGNRGAWDAFALPKLSGPEIARKRAAEKLARAVAGDTGGDGRDTPPPTSETISEVPDALTAAPAPVVSEMETTAPVPADPVITAETFHIPAPSLRSSSPCPGCAGDLAGIGDAVCARCRVQLVGTFTSDDHADKSAALDEIRRVLAPVLGIGETEDNAQGMVGRVAQRTEAQAVRIRFLEEEVAGVDDPLGLSEQGRTRYPGDRTDGARGLAQACKMYEAREKDLHALLETGSVKYDDLCGAIDALKQKARERDMLVIECNAIRAELDEIRRLLDESRKCGEPECSVANRVELLLAYVTAVEKEGGHYAQLCQDAHDTLDGAGVPHAGTLGDRIRRAGRLIPDACARAILLYAVAEALDGTGHGKAGRAELLRLTDRTADPTDRAGRRDRAVVQLALAEAALVAAGLEAGDRGEGDSWDDFGDMLERVVEAVVNRVEGGEVADVE